MDKILITAFRNEIATAILNSQDKLNPDKDAYISAEELPAVLDFFGEKDVNKLLKPSDDKQAESVFTEAKQDESNASDVDAEEFSKLADANAVIRKDGSAAYELNSNIASDLVLTSASGTPFSAQMNNLYETRKELIKKHKDTSEIDAKINALNEAVQEYVKTNHIDITQTMIENGTVKSFKYGKNDEKTGYFIQTFDFKGGNNINKDNDDSDVSTDADTDADTDTDKDNNDGGNQAGFNIRYGVELFTDKLHAIGNIEAGSDNSDIQGVVVYKNKLKNDADLSFSGNFRQTIEKNNNNTRFGASADYSQKKFSTGVYASYESSEVESERHKVFDAEAYVKYGNSVRVGFGHESETLQDVSTKYNFVNAKISGKRELNNSNLTLSGSVEGSYGVAHSEGESLPNYNIMAKGGLTFKSNNIKTNLFANVDYDVAKNVINDHDARTISATLVGNVCTDKIDVTATVSAMNAPEFTINSLENNDITVENKWGYSSSITVSPKNIFGKNSKVVPSVTYSVSNGEQLKHYVGMNLGVNF